MLNIKISKNSVNSTDSVRLIKVKYQQPVNGKYHPFDTRAEEKHYISENGFSFLGDIDTITRRECIEEIESQLGLNRHIRFIYQRLLIVHNGMIVWDTIRDRNYGKDYFKGFVIHALYGDFIVGEHKYGYNITNTGMCADEVYIWENCDIALSRALNFSKSHPENYCLLAGINFDYNEVFEGAKVPPWAIAEVDEEIMTSLVSARGRKFIYNTDAFFDYFNTLTRKEKKALIKQYPEPEKWRNWYSVQGAHQVVDITKAYKVYTEKCEERKAKRQLISVPPNRSEKKNEDLKVIDENEYMDAKEIFVNHNGSLADMCADETVEKYMGYGVPKLLEQKWIEELIEIWLENISEMHDSIRSCSEILNIVHKDNKFELITQFADALEKSYFLMDENEFINICEMITERLDYNKFSDCDEYFYLLDKLEVFTSEIIERKNETDDAKTVKARGKLAKMLQSIMLWQMENLEE